MSRATKNQLAFALAYLETGKPSESYRAAGYKCDKMSDGHIAEEAQRLLNNPHVARIIEQGRAEARERSQVTIESLTDELEEDRQAALNKIPCNPAAAVAATMAKARLHGLMDGQGSQPEKAVNIGGQPVETGASKWGAVKAEVEAEWRRKRKEERRRAMGPTGTPAA